MKIIHNLKKYVLSLAIILFGLMPIGISVVKADDATLNSVSITDYQLSSKIIDNTVNNNHILGSIKIKNPHDYQINNIYVQIEVLKENTETDNQIHGHIIKRENVSGYINLKPNQEVSQNIDIEIGTHLYTGNYFVTASVYDQTSIKIAGQSKKIAINGDGSLLAIDVESAFIQKGTEKLKSMSGPTLSANDKASFIFTVQNRSNNAATFIPKIEVYTRGEFPGIDPVDLEVFDKNSIEGLQSKDISINIPNIVKSESYLVKAYLVDKTGIISSTVVYYRFVVSGEGGKILATRITSYRNWTSEVFSLRNSLIGPADATELTDAKIKVTLLEGDKEIKSSVKSIGKLGITQVDVLDEISISKTPFQSSKNYTAKIELIGANNNVLHTVTVSIPKTKLPLMQISIIILLLLALVLAIGRFYIWPKFINTKKRPILSRG